MPLFPGYDHGHHFGAGHWGEQSPGLCSDRWPGCEASRFHRGGLFVDICYLLFGDGNSFDHLSNELALTVHLPQALYRQCSPDVSVGLEADCSGAAPDLLWGWSIADMTSQYGMSALHPRAGIKAGGRHVR